MSQQGLQKKAKVQLGSSAPLRLSLGSSEQVILDFLTPHLEQLVELTNSTIAKNKDMAHSRMLAMHIGFCVRMAFDHQMFADKGTYTYAPLAASKVVPERASEYSVIVLCCESNLVESVDNCLVTFRLPGSEDVESEAHHLMGNMFCIPVPPIEGLTNTWSTVEVLMTCKNFSVKTSVELRRPPVSNIVRVPYSAFHMPLHYATLRDDVPSVLLQLDKLAPEDSRPLDECGLEPATLALSRGNRVLYTLFAWKSLRWPVYAVCQLLRSRLELESCLLDAEVFLGLRDAIHEFVHHAGPDVKYRPLMYQTHGRKNADGTLANGGGAAGGGGGVGGGPLASMLLSEIPYTEHEAITPTQVDNVHRRGSLDVLLHAIDILDTSSSQRK